MKVETMQRIGLVLSTVIITLVVAIISRGFDIPFISTMMPVLLYYILVATFKTGVKK